jgi:CheY-like chemotaxis protein
MRTFGFRRPTEQNRLAGRRVLIVEDEAMISALIEMIVGEAGCSIVGSVATLERALEIIERESFDAALLDVHVNGHDIYAVADVLRARGIPFVLVSGFARKQLPPRYRHCPYIAKPFVPDTILTVLEEVVAGKR